MVRKYSYKLALLLLLTSGVTCFAQKSTSDKLLKEAKVLFEEEDYLPAWQIYKKILKAEPMHELAGEYAALTAWRLNYAVDSSLFLIENLTASKLDDSKFYLAKIKHKHKKFDEAIALLEGYLKNDSKLHLQSASEANHLINCCKNAKTFIAQAHSSIIKNMGAQINTLYDDYVPVIAPDESAMYFTSKRFHSTGDKKNGDNAYFEDVYVSQNVDGVWKKAENIGFPINSESNDACVAISPDGTKMIVYRTSEDGLTGHLYLSKMGVHHHWEPLQLLGPEINSEYTETSACFSRDTSEIYFSSNRPGGLGGKDIYRIKKLPNGKWAAPFNLGPNVNTEMDEDAPFMHPDGVTLYFSSTGHNTMGEFDVFKSVWNVEANEFSKAENLGYPINDVNNDIFFVLSVDGQRGYYSSVKADCLGGIDIYQVDTRFGDNDLYMKQGYTYLGTSPGRVNITLLDKDSNEEIGRYQSNPNNGKFMLVLNPLKSYHIILEEEGYETIETDLNPVATEAADEKLRFILKKSNAH